MWESRGQVERRGRVLYLKNKKPLLWPCVKNFLYSDLLLEERHSAPDSFHPRCISKDASSSFFFSFLLVYSGGTVLLNLPFLLRSGGGRRTCWLTFLRRVHYGSGWDASRFDTLSLFEWEKYLKRETGPLTGMRSSSSSSS